MKNDVDVDKNDTITVLARERDLVREREIRVKQGSNRQQQYVVGAFFLLSCRH